MKLPLRHTLLAVLVLLLVLSAVLLPWPTTKQRGTEQPAGQNTVATAKDSPVASAVTGNGALESTNDVLLHAVPAGSQVPGVVAIAVGQGTAHDFHVRLDAIGKLGIDLAPEALSAVYAYLRNPAEEPDLMPGQSFALKNDLLNVLREQRRTPADLTRLLMDIRRDEAQPLVMRDYALQHLAPWFVRAGAEERRQIVDELQAAAAEIHQSYAGTALLALHRVRQEQAGAEVPALSEPILKLLGDSSADLLARVTAVQLSGSLGLTESAPFVASLAFGESVAPVLRTAAIRAVGALGILDVEDRLRETSIGADPRFRPAALAALKQSDGASRRN